MKKLYAVSTVIRTAHLCDVGLRFLCTDFAFRTPGINI